MLFVPLQKSLCLDWLAHWHLWKVYKLFVNNRCMMPISCAHCRTKSDKRQLRTMNKYFDNRPFYSSLFSELAFERQRGRKWPCFDRRHCFCCVNQVILMLTSFHLHENNREVCIKARPPSASFAVRGQVTKHTTLEWHIYLLDVAVVYSV